MRILYINLDRCPERAADTVAELARWGLTGERIPAVDGKLLALDDSGSIAGYKTRGRTKEHSYRGSAGCFFSHCLALEEAIRGGIWPCLILEDDVAITAAPTLPDTASPIVYLGGLDVEGKGVYGGHAICYKTPEAAESMLNELRKMPSTNDGASVRLQRRQPDLFHFARPYSIYQKAGHSFIQEKHLAARGVG